MNHRSLPLDGLFVVEFAGIGPAPFACGMLRELGATVVRIERPGGSDGTLPGGLSTLGATDRLIVELDLKSTEGRNAAMDLLAVADVAVEGFRPGVLERLDLGPDRILERNQRIVICRLTGWGQDGPYSAMAGHDINYIGLSGALHSIGDGEPVPPLNLVGDYAGGSMFAVVGILAALLERERSGRGQVIDAAMVDGSAALMGPVRELLNHGLWTDRRASNLLDGGAPFYRTYETRDGGFMAVGALEPAFYSALVDGLGLDENALPDRYDKNSWGALHAMFAEVFVGRTRSEWTAHFEGTDACVTPVLSMAEVAENDHNRSRGVMTGTPGAERAGPAPRFSASVRSRTNLSVSDTLVALGMPAERAESLESSGESYWV